MLLNDARISKTASIGLLEAWAQERRKSVDHAAFMSLMNGQLCNNRPAFWMLGLLRLLALLNAIPFFRRNLDPQAIKEREGFTLVENGFFIKNNLGGSRLAQIVVQSPKQGPMLSDQLLQSKGSIMKLIVVTTGQYANDYTQAKTAIGAAKINSAVISTDSILLFSNTKPEGSPDVEVFWPAADWRSVSGDRKGYDPSSFVDRLGSRTRFALVRPDFFVYACAKDLRDLKKCLSVLHDHLYS